MMYSHVINFANRLASIESELASLAGLPADGEPIARPPEVAKHVSAFVRYRIWF